MFFKRVNESNASCLCDICSIRKIAHSVQLVKMIESLEHVQIHTLGATVFRPEYSKHQLPTSPLPAQVKEGTDMNVLAVLGLVLRGFTPTRIHMGGLNILDHWQKTFQIASMLSDMTRLIAGEDIDSHAMFDGGESEVTRRAV